MEKNDCATASDFTKTLHKSSKPKMRRSVSTKARGWRPKAQKARPKAPRAKAENHEEGTAMALHGSRKVSGFRSYRLQDLEGWGSGSGFLFKCGSFMSKSSTSGMGWIIYGQLEAEGCNGNLPQARAREWSGSGETVPTLSKRLGQISKASHL